MSKFWNEILDVWQVTKNDTLRSIQTDQTKSGAPMPAEQICYTLDTNWRRGVEKCHQILKRARDEDQVEAEDERRVRLRKTEYIDHTWTLDQKGSRQFLKDLDEMKVRSTNNQLFECNCRTALRCAALKRNVTKPTCFHRMTSRFPSYWPARSCFERSGHRARERLQRIIYTHSFAEGAPAPIDLTGSPSGAPLRTPSTPADRPNESPPSSSRTLRYAMSTYTTPTTSPFKLHPSQASDSPEL